MLSDAVLSIALLNNLTILNIKYCVIVYYVTYVIR